MVLKKRVVCGLSVAAVWLVAIMVLPVWVLVGLIAVSAGICLYELCAMLKKAGYELPFKTLAGMTAGWFIFKGVALLSDPMTYMGAGTFLMPLAATIAAVLFFRVLLDHRIQKPMETAALTVVSFFYIPFMLSFMIDLVAMGKWMTATSLKNAPDGPGIFLAFFFILVTKLCDTGGYFVGSRFGKHKMCPRLSPGKSWEGTLGGYAASLLAAIILMVIALCSEWSVFGALRMCSQGGLFVWMLVTVIVVVTVGILGDLVESLFKRQCDVKDSSALFPAMGGFFDTFDSIIFVPAVAVLLLQLAQ